MGDEEDGKRALTVIGMHGTPHDQRAPTPVPVSTGPGFDNALPFTSAAPMAPLSQREALQGERPRRTDTAPPPAPHQAARRQPLTEPPPMPIDAFEGIDMRASPATAPPPAMPSFVDAAHGTAPPPAQAGMPLPFIPRAGAVPSYQAASAFMQPASSTPEPSSSSVLGVKRVEGISIEEFASVRVALWSNVESRQNVLRRMGLSELRWRVVMRRWSEELSTMRVRPAELAEVIDHVRRAGRKADG